MAAVTYQTVQDLLNRVALNLGEDANTPLAALAPGPTQGGIVISANDQTMQYLNEAARLVCKTVYPILDTASQVIGPLAARGQGTHGGGATPDILPFVSASVAGAPYALISGYPASVIMTDVGGDLNPTTIAATIDWADTPPGVYTLTLNYADGGNNAVYTATATNVIGPFAQLTTPAGREPFCMRAVYTYWANKPLYIPQALTGQIASQPDYFWGTGIPSEFEDNVSGGQFSANPQQVATYFIDGYCWPIPFTTTADTLDPYLDQDVLTDICLIASLLVANKAEDVSEIGPRIPMLRSQMQAIFNSRYSTLINRDPSLASWFGPEAALGAVTQIVKQSTVRT